MNKSYGKNKLFVRNANQIILYIYYSIGITSIFAIYSKVEIIEEHVNKIELMWGWQNIIGIKNNLQL